MRVAIVGAGWAGLAAAVACTRNGHAVTLLETARVPGGRARTLAVDLPDGGTARLDNGQHILIGAYVETLKLMEEVGVRPADVLLRLPLTLLDPQGRGLVLPEWPAPLDAAGGILAARGWSARDKLSLLAAATRWQLARFRCAEHLSVAELARGLTPRVVDELIEPLCVAALNTPGERSSAAVFLRVLRDGLFGRGHGGWGGSNLLIPRQALGAVFPDAAQAWLAGRGAEVRLGRRAQSLAPQGAGWRLDGEDFDAVILAASASEAARLVEDSGVDAGGWSAQAAALQFEPIATVYAQGGPALPLPMLALRSGPAQFVFDRAQLGGPAGLLAFVASACTGDKDAIEREVLAQARDLGWNLRPLRTVVERRATFACLPGLRRPPAAIAPGLWACGDYVDGPYPATLEGAVRAALDVAAALGGAQR